MIPVVDPFSITEDPKMPFLAKAINPAEARDKLEQYLLHPACGNHNVYLHAIRVIRYKPARRCMIEYDLEICSPQPEKVTVIGKVQAQGPRRSTYYVLNSLYNAGFGQDSQDGICVPETAGIIPEFNMLLQRKVSGDTATRLLIEPGGTALSRRIARAAHKLHRADIPVKRRHTMVDELRILHERLSIVARMMPDRAERLERILDSCDQIGAATPKPELCGIHRDFYPDQVIADGSHLYLIDFDLYCEGDPGLDIGNFLGHLIELSLRTFNDPDALSDRTEAMEEEFVALSGEHTRASVRAYSVLTLVRHIYLSTQFPERRNFTEPLLELCEQRLARCIPKL
ncbi:phosphotransferase family protein [Candidatus Methanoperedens nitroreducens]|uniref:Phosphotransferase family protein n=1 Tax=Candidatus Methanoperedens nitratireducens TaxID=1392998 RepID=A0A062VA85_9EURY|nr:phosphotransferase [Candidatus Methanoperedens nitroreducens]KCZ73408.1 phosphotransferase family protein [Candidatus Methanoperedens nitroreducens]MDJ1422637.1 phosphotransferase [Candidatus Methanoperedens sp.]